MDFGTLPKTGLKVCSKSDITMDYCSDYILWDLLKCTHINSDLEYP